ncbi:MAG: DJ-1/PfpI family protein [Vallitaleaceae bacterium]|nr:DJ-1/PfpI family protein [Vallitaleaceae bacterium]
MKAVVVLAKGFEETEAIAIVDVLRRGEVEVDMVSIAGNIEVEGAHGIYIRADKLFYDIPYDDVDMIILPGGMPGTNNLGKNEDLCELIKSFNAQGKWIAAICAAPSVLGKLGVLEGKSATCYPGFEEALSGCLIKNEDIVKSHNILTAKGVGVAIKFALEILTLCQSLSYVEELRRKLIVSKYS